MSETEVRVNVEVCQSGEKPPRDSPAHTVVWWLTRPWLNAVAIATPIAIAGSVLMLFTYLSRIGRGDLLLQAMAPSTSLMLVVVAALLLAIVWAITIFGSGFLIHQAVEIYPIIPCAMPRRLSKAVLVWTVTWWALLYVGTLQSDEHFGAYVWGLLVGVVFFSVLLHVVEQLQRGWAWRCLRRFVGVVVAPVQSIRRCMNGVRRYLKWSWTWQCLRHFVGAAVAPIQTTRRCVNAVRQRYGHVIAAVLVGFIVGIVMWFALVIAALAPLDLLIVVPSLGSTQINWGTALMWVGASVPGPLGGWLYTHKIAQGQSAAELRKRVVWIAIAVACIFVTASLYPISMQVLRVLGVYSTAESKFAISSQSLVPSFEAAHVGPVVEPTGNIAVTVPTAVAKAKQGDDGAAPTITAFVRFHFGDQLVLCTTPYDPLEAPARDSKYAIQGKDGKMKWKQGNCLDVRADDVRHIMVPDRLLRSSSS